MSEQTSTIGVSETCDVYENRGWYFNRVQGHNSRVLKRGASAEYPKTGLWEGWKLVQVDVPPGTSVQVVMKHDPTGMEETKTYKTQ